VTKSELQVEPAILESKQPEVVPLDDHANASSTPQTPRQSGLFPAPSPIVKPFSLLPVSAHNGMSQVDPEEPCKDNSMEPLIARSRPVLPELLCRTGQQNVPDSASFHLFVKRHKKDLPTLSSVRRSV